MSIFLSCLEQPWMNLIQAFNKLCNFLSSVSDILQYKELQKSNFDKTKLLTNITRMEVFNDLLMIDFKKDCMSTENRSFGFGLIWYSNSRRIFWYHFQLDRGIFRPQNGHLKKALKIAEIQCFSIQPYACYN